MSTMTANHRQDELLDPTAGNDGVITANDNTDQDDGDNNEDDDDNNNDNISQTELPGVPLPKNSTTRQESRDVSICSRNTRDSLRRQVSTRSNTFTEYERSFLEQLTIDGSDREVEMALKTVENEDLFFDHCTPRHLKHNNGDEIGLNISDTSHTSDAFDDDAPRDGDAPSVATTERRGLLGAATSSLTSSSIKNGKKDNSNINSGTTSSTKMSSASPSVVPSTILGSKRRHLILERRRSERTLTKLWRAHESGLAVTASGSRKSLLRRESSVSSIGSVASAMSGLSVLFGKHPHPDQQDIFRSDNDDDDGSRKQFLTRSLPPMTRPSPHRRSKSVTRSMLMSRRASQKSLPKIPEPISFKKNDRRSSFASDGRKKSVTFHAFNEELEFDKGKTALTTVDDAADANKLTSSSKQQDPRSKIVRRAMSDSHLPVTDATDKLDEDQEQKEDPRKLMMQRETSNSSIPSLHHGQPLRSSSISSIPSLHHGNAIRQDSVASFASLHHATPIRQDSMSTVRQNSIASFASLHHGAPIRQDSISTIPSLHHGRPVRQDSIASSINLNPMTRDQMVRQFGVTEDVASAWVQLESSSHTDLMDSEHKQTSSSSPRDMAILLTVETDPTIDNTIDDDDLTVLSAVSKREDSASPSKPVLMRLASRNMYEGEGVEVTEIEDEPIDDDHSRYQYRDNSTAFRNISQFLNNDVSIRNASSFDDVSIFSSFGKQQRTSDVFRNIRKSLSDENMSTPFFGSSRDLLLQIPNSSDEASDTFADELSEGGSASWEMEFGGSPKGRFDAWNILQDEYVNGYGGGGSLGFKILGTSVADESSQPHVLSPPLMESLQAFLPSSKSGENFYMKYSMVRDGAHLQTLLKRARGVQYSILAIETLDGEVFGSFTGEAWRKSWNYFGTGESFLWKMRNSRLEKTHGILDQAHKESEIDVYPYTGENGFIQLCTHDRVAVGGGMPDSTSAEKKTDEPIDNNPPVDHSHNWGFGLALQSDLLQGSSSPCITFGSPSLSNAHPDGSLFEILNIELWTPTPCMTEEEAEKLELGKLFLHQNK